MTGGTCRTEVGDCKLRFVRVVVSAIRYAGGGNGKRRRNDIVDGRQGCGGLAEEVAAVERRLAKGPCDGDAKVTRIIASMRGRVDSSAIAGLDGCRWVVWRVGKERRRAKRDGSFVPVDHDGHKPRYCRIRIVNRKLIARGTPVGSWLAQRVAGKDVVITLAPARLEVAERRGILNEGQTTFPANSRLAWKGAQRQGPIGRICAQYLGLAHWLEF